MGHLYHGYVSHNQVGYIQNGAYTPSFQRLIMIYHIFPRRDPLQPPIKLQFWAFKHHVTRHWWCWDGQNSALRHCDIVQTKKITSEAPTKPNKTNTKAVSWIPNQKRIQLGGSGVRLKNPVTSAKDVVKNGPQKSVAQHFEGFKIVVSPVKMAENLGFAPPFSDATDTMITMTCPTIRIPIWFPVWFPVYPPG